MERAWQNPETLRELYIEEGLTYEEIANRLGCTAGTIGNWAKRHGINPRGGHRTGGEWTDKELMEELYVERGMSMGEIADELDCGSTTIERWIDRHGIGVRDSVTNTDRPWRDKPTLRELYVDKGLSVSEVADEFGCAFKTARRWLHKHDIPVRERHGGVVGETSISVDSQGYERVWSSDEYVYLHRLLVAVDRPLDELEGKDVHHRNEVPWDNRPENLELLSHGDHSEKHSPKNPYRGGPTPKGE